MKNIFTLILLLTGFSVFSQNTEAELKKLIYEKDSLFWVGYNTCNLELVKGFLYDDVEFYHDKGGPLFGSESLVSAIKKGLCSSSNYKLRREGLNFTTTIFPMANNGVYYGAIISGDHFFYVTSDGKPEYRDGLAKFSQLWLKKDGVWKISRIYSYDHGPADRKTK